METWAWACRVTLAQLIGSGIPMIQHSAHREKRREAAECLESRAFHDGHFYALAVEETSGGVSTARKHAGAARVDSRKWDKLERH